MPISEDEYDPHRQQQHHALSKAEQRRSNKPIMEKRRRARINHCLNELKTLILDAMKKDPARHSKLEKADILEMTVRHLQSVQRQQLAVAVATDPAVLSKFRTGFSECAGEVGRYLGRLPGVEPAVRQRLSGHLSQCVAGLQQLDPNNNPGGGNTSAAPSGLALVPHRLPTGEIALVLPPGLLPFPASATLQAAAASSTTTTTGTSNVTPGTTARPSAFTAVNPKVAPPPQPPSPLPSPTSTISDDDSLITEPYPRPPSPAVRPHQESACFKVPNFPLFPLTEEKPHQQPHVTSSTSDSASGSSSMTQMQQQQIVQTTPAVPAVAEVKVEFKTVPVVSTALYDSRLELHPPALPIDRPLTIVTRQDDNSIYASSTVTSLSSKTDVPIFPCKNALDFSLKREDYIHLNESPPVQVLGASNKRSYAATESGEEVMSSSLLMVQPPNKIPRLSFQVEVPNSGLHAVSASSPMVSASQDDATAGPSTSNTETTSSGSGKDMWRPW